GPFVDPGSSEEVDWVVAERIERGTIGFIVGPSGVGKTAFAMALANSVGAPRSDVRAQFFGRDVVQGSVLVFTGEDSPGTARRGRRHAEHFGLGFPHVYVVPAALSLTDAAAALDRTLLYLDRIPNGAPAPALIIIDHARDALAGADENDASSVAPAMQVAELVAKATKTAVIILHHTGHSKGRERGSSVFRDKSAFTLLLNADVTGTVTGTVEKVKSAPAGERFMFHLNDAGVVIEGPSVHAPTLSTEEPASQLVARLVGELAADGGKVSRADLAAEMAEASPARFGSGVENDSTRRNNVSRAITAARKLRWVVMKGRDLAPGEVPPAWLPPLEVQS